MIKNALTQYCLIPCACIFHLTRGSKDVLIGLIGLEREPDLRTLKLIGIKGYPPLPLFALHT